MSWYIASMFIVGSAIGMLLATKFKKSFNDKVLQTIFSIMLVILGVVIYLIN
ncbi:sulfite exporter TauE/SafE family protein, partial [Francisella tularensis subsp. holarctica]|nr:sulfite exporter TauE/SafE family protein [Francisella tularensis subsp. holarctica]